MKTKDLVLMAMYVALFAVLEYFSSMVKIVVMPNGNVIQDAAPGEGQEGFYKPVFLRNHWSFSFRIV